MASKAAIVSAADEGYFELLLGLIQSILDHRPNADIDLCVIDLGMNSRQLQQLRLIVNYVVPGRWDFDFPAQATMPRWYQGMSARPFLRDYFPGYDHYLWLDGDTWLADWQPIELLRAGAAGPGIAAVPEIHCAYPYLYGVGNLRQLNEQQIGESFGEDAARILSNRAIINAGVFAVARDAPFWEHYRQFVEAGYRRAPNKWTEQYAMNLVFYTQKISFQMLPANCNWICCYAAPMLDPQRRCLCEPVAPFARLSLVHITAINKPGLRLRTTTGEQLEMPIDYRGFRDYLNKHGPPL